jgi:uncharacterized membrane protein
MEAKELGKTSTGMQPNIAALLSYLFGALTGILFYLIEKENKFVRFHAMQSIITFGSIFVASVIVRFMPIVGRPLALILGFANIVLWIVLMVKAYQKKMFKLPVIGDIAEKNS